jgi:hypothetical protein
METQIIHMTDVKRLIIVEMDFVTCYALFGYNRNTEIMMELQNSTVLIVPKKI